MPHHKEHAPHQREPVRKDEADIHKEREAQAGEERERQRRPPLPASQPDVEGYRPGRFPGLE